MKTGILGTFSSQMRINNIPTLNVLAVFTPTNIEDTFADTSLVSQSSILMIIDILCIPMWLSFLMICI